MSAISAVTSTWPLYHEGSLERILKVSHLANQDSSYRIPGDFKHLPFLNNGGHCAPRNTLQKWFSDRSYTGFHWWKRINQTRLVDMMCWWNLCQTEFELFSHWMLRLEMNDSLILLSLMKNRSHSSIQPQTEVAYSVFTHSKHSQCLGWTQIRKDHYVWLVFSQQCQ